MNPKNNTTSTQNQNLSSDGQFACWYFTPGFHTTFGGKKGTIFLSPGRLQLKDNASGEVVYDYNLYPDIKVNTLEGGVIITFMNNVKTKPLDYRYYFFFYNPRLGLIRFIFKKDYSSKAMNFINGLSLAASATNK